MGFMEYHEVTASFAWWFIVVVRHLSDHFSYTSIQYRTMFGMKSVADQIKSNNRKTACTVSTNMSFLKAHDVDVVSLLCPR